MPHGAAETTLSTTPQPVLGLAATPARGDGVALGEATKPTKAPRLTPSQSADVRSLIDDSGYSRRDAVALVRAGMGRA